MGKELEAYPEPVFRDYVRTGIETGVAAIPVVGGSIQVLAEVVLAPALTKRRDRWFKQLHEMMVELQARVDDFDPQVLAEDEAFVTALGEASRIAMGTHLEEKLEMLKRCLVRMAVDQNRDAFLDLRFFRYIDELDPEHFVILKYLMNPGAWFDAKGIARPSIVAGSPKSVMGEALLPLSGVPLELALRDLADRMLADVGALGVTMTEHGIWESRVTDLGRELIEFVEEI